MSDEEESHEAVPLVDNEPPHHQNTQWCSSSFLKRKASVITFAMVIGTIAIVFVNLNTNKRRFNKVVTPGFCEYFSGELTGDVLKQQNNMTLEMCHQECTSHPECIAWTSSEKLANCKLLSSAVGDVIYSDAFAVYGYSGKYEVLHLVRRRREETYYKSGSWSIIAEKMTWDPQKTALIVTDMWDSHWCEFLKDRVTELVPAVNQFVNIARDKGVLIVHSPSDTMKHYNNTAARNRIVNNPDVIPPELAFLYEKTYNSKGDPHKPFSVHKGCPCARPEERCRDHIDSHAWTSEHPGIRIDHKIDVVADRGHEIYNYLSLQKRTNALILGVHLTKCILKRSYGIRSLSKAGLDIMLVRDLTDVSYDPAKDSPPNLTLEEMSDLVVEYVERYYGASILSTELTDAPPFKFENVVLPVPYVYEEETSSTSSSST